MDYRSYVLTISSSNRPTGDVLSRLYNEDKLSHRQIGRLFGVTEGAVSKWMRKEGIPIRPFSEAQRLIKTGKPWTEKERAAHMAYRATPEYREKQASRQRGEKSHLWKGGKIKDEALRLQGWQWRYRRKECYARDNWTCQDCGVHCTSRGKTKIQAHHIVSRRNGGSDDLTNLVTLCISCHHKREWTERKEVV